MTVRAASWLALVGIGAFAPLPLAAQDDPFTYEPVRSIREYYGPVGSAHFLKNGSLVSCGKDKLVRLLDQNGKPVRDLRGHKDLVHRLAVNRDGTKAASVGQDGLLIIWDLSTGEKLREIAVAVNPPHNYGRCVVYHPSLDRVAVAMMDGTAREYDAGTGQQTFKVKATSGICYAVAYKPDGTQLAVGGKQAFKTWDLATQKVVETYEGHEESDITALCYSGRGDFIASGATDQLIKIWEVKTRQLSDLLEGHEGTVLALAFDPSDTYLASSGEDAPVYLWDHRGGAMKAKLEGHGNSVQSVSFSADGSILASAGMDSTIRYWSVPDGRPLRTVKPHGGTIYSIGFSPDDNYVAAAGQEYTVKMWTVGDGKLAKTLQKGWDDTIHRIAFSPEHPDDLAVGYKNGSIKLWSIGGESLKYEFLGAHRVDVNGLAFVGGGRYLVSGGSDSLICVWNLQSKQLLRKVGHDSAVRSISGHPREAQFASCDSAGHINLWKVDEKKKAVPLQLTIQLAHDSIINSIAYGPDGTKLASAGNDGRVKVFDVRTGKALEIFSAPAVPTMVAFHPDGKYVAASCRNNTVAVWRLGRKDPVQVLEGYLDEVNSLAFDGDGELLATGTWDGELKIWKRKQAK